MPDSIYDDVIMDHIKNARNFRELPEATTRAEGVNPLCGDTFTIYLSVEGDRIRDASFQCTCCGISMASASVMTEMLRERTLPEARALAQEFRELVRAVGEPQDPGVEDDRLAILSVVRASPARGNCASLAWHTLDAALSGQDRVTLR